MFGPSISAARARSLGWTVCPLMDVPHDPGLLERSAIRVPPGLSVPVAFDPADPRSVPAGRGLAGLLPHRVFLLSDDGGGPVVCMSQIEAPAPSSGPA